MRAARTNEAAANPEEQGTTEDGRFGALFAAALGLLLGLSLLKFGNPVILEREIDYPSDVYQWVLTPWPPVIGYWLLGAVALLGLLVARWQDGIPRTVIALPLLWLAWEAVSGTQTVDTRLTRETLIHFTTCVACFYLGLLGLGGTRRMWPFWTGLLAGFLLVLASGFEQHFGGLEQTRRYYFLYIYPTLKEPPPTELLKRMSTNRIFSTLFYPNTLAGVILMLLPAMLAFVGSLKEQMTGGARRVLSALIGAAALACLFWSGSKGGWLIMLIIGFVAATFLPMRRRWKLLLVGLVLVVGLSGFLIRYAGFFQKGATSVVARFDYWHGAWAAVKEKPILGSGPGTFGVSYKRLKRPEAEMSHLAHNDYLQQASDSGLPGGLLYVCFVVGTLAYCGRKGGMQRDWVRLAVWLGLLASAIQSTVEFGLYIPAVAWPAFTFMGSLVAQSANQSTSAIQSAKKELPE